MVQDVRTGEHLLLFGDRKWTDYDVELEAMPTGGAGELNVVVRATSVSDLSLAILGGWNNTSHGILPMVGGKFRVAAAAPGKTTLARWHKVKVEVRGPVCRLFVDGSAVVQSPAFPTAAGQVGLRTFNTSGRFRNIKVSDPQGKVLFEGLPELPAGKSQGARGKDTTSRLMASRRSGASSRSLLSCAGWHVIHTIEVS